MNTTKSRNRSRDDEKDAAPFMGSEYMDARSYLEKPARIKRSSTAPPVSDEANVPAVPR